MRRHALPGVTRVNAMIKLCCAAADLPTYLPTYLVRNEVGHLPMHIPGTYVKQICVNAETFLMFSDGVVC